MAENPSNFTLPFHGQHSINPALLWNRQSAQQQNTTLNPAQLLANNSAGLAHGPGGPGLGVGGAGGVGGLGGANMATINPAALAASTALGAQNPNLNMAASASGAQMGMGPMPGIPQHLQFQQLANMSPQELQTAQAKAMAQRQSHLPGAPQHGNNTPNQGYPPGYYNPASMPPPQQIAPRPPNVMSQPGGVMRPPGPLPSRPGTAAGQHPQHPQQQQHQQQMQHQQMQHQHHANQMAGPSNGYAQQQQQQQQQHHQQQQQMSRPPSRPQTAQSNHSHAGFGSEPHHSPTQQSQNGQSYAMMQRAPTPSQQAQLHHQQQQQQQQQANAQNQGGGGGSQMGSPYLGMKRKLPSSGDIQQQQVQQGPGSAGSINGQQQMQTPRMGNAGLPMQGQQGMMGMAGMNNNMGNMGNMGGMGNMSMGQAQAQAQMLKQMGMANMNMTNNNPNMNMGGMMPPPSLPRQHTGPSMSDQQHQQGMQGSGMQQQQQQQQNQQQAGGAGQGGAQGQGQGQGGYHPGMGARQSSHEPQTPISGGGMVNGIGGGSGGGVVGGASGNSAIGAMGIGGGGANNNNNNNNSMGGGAGAMFSGGMSAPNNFISQYGMGRLNSLTGMNPMNVGMNNMAANMGGGMNAMAGGSGVGGVGAGAGAGGGTMNGMSEEQMQARLTAMASNMAGIGNMGPMNMGAMAGLNLTQLQQLQLQQQQQNLLHRQQQQQHQNQQQHQQHHPQQNPQTPQHQQQQHAMSQQQQHSSLPVGMQNIAQNMQNLQQLQASLAQNPMAMQQQQQQHAAGVGMQRPGTAMSMGSMGGMGNMAPFGGAPAPGLPNSAPPNPNVGMNNIAMNASGMTAPLTPGPNMPPVNPSSIAGIPGLPNSMHGLNNLPMPASSASASAAAAAAAQMAQMQAMQERKAMAAMGAGGGVGIGPAGIPPLPGNPNAMRVGTPSSSPVKPAFNAPPIPALAPSIMPPVARPGTAQPGSIPPGPIPPGPLASTIPPIPTASAAAATPSAGPSAAAAQAQANGLNLLPPGVNVNPAVTRVTPVPLSQADEQIPPLSDAEVADIQGWMETDKAYEERFRTMRDRMRGETAEWNKHAKWWERDPERDAILRERARERDGRIPQFNIVYPRREKDLERERRERRGKGRREGLKVPKKLSAEDADREEQLVPIRLEFDVEHQRYRDTFVWNINDPVVTPEAFAQSIVDDYSLPQSYFSTITKSIQEQLSDYKTHSALLADEDLAPSQPSSYSTGTTEGPVRGTLNGDSLQWWEAWRRRLRSKNGFVRKSAIAQASSCASHVKKRRKVGESKSSASAKEVIASKPLLRALKAGEDDAMNVNDFELDEDKMQEEMRILIKLDITVGSMKLDDQFEWDIDNEDASPEQFAEVYGNDLGLTGEFKTAIAHAIREQVHSYQKSLFIVGRPSDGSAIQDEDLRMSFLPYVSSGPRPVDQTQAFTPILNYLSDGEIERIDKEREKELNKRRKRNTRGRRGIALPDREPIKTHRTPAIGFPEVDPNTLALAAALAPPPTRRGAAIAASVTIANMVASENGTTILPQSQPVQPQPVPQIVSRLAKPKGSFKAPAYAPDVLKRRAKVSAPTPSTAADASTFGPPLEGDNPLPPSSSAAAPPDSRSSKIITARRQRELEKEAKEKEFADGQHANMIDGVWHCSNCGCPDPIAIGRRKGPLGDKSQCGACGKFWHRHRRPRPVDYHADAEYHINLKLESERARTPARKRGAAALKAQNQAQQEQTPPPSVSEHDASLSKHELWNEKSIRKGKQAQTSGSGPLDRPLSPASSVSSSASERPLAETVLQANGVNHKSAHSKGSSTASSEPPPPPESNTKDLTASTTNGDATSSSVKSTSEVKPDPAAPPPQRPEWLDNALAEVLVKYPDDKLDIIPRRGAGPVEWRIKCLDCPGKLYTPGPGETLNNFEVHLKNRQHRHKVSARVDAANAANGAP